ncbi:hypothetical protein [Aureimonas sp. AU20]|uniref:hypothetical protein n=1 Tax=Aureimonas sp. AU20 TaxID=1349819 RepID=UPI0007209322|nr:hypothetical protein [Aureimonas sp. AU20]ALN73526.1 hypothetical protein M673_12440 [Aureimonas sp. AU20]
MDAAFIQIAELDRLWPILKGATLSLADCREGFRKPLKAVGYECLSVNFVKDL